VAVLISVAAPFVAYAATRNAFIDSARSKVDASATFLPRSSWAEIKSVMRVGRQPQQRLPAGAADVARGAAVRFPLAYEPYFIAARAEEQAGRYRRATVLMEEARRRRPNSTSVRFLLLGYYSLANAYQKAIDEADMAMRVNSRSMTLILPAFAKLVAVDPKARQAIAVALAKEPVWRQAFLEVAANEKMDPDAAAALVADVRRLSPSRIPGPEEVFLIRVLFNAGEARRARALWESYQPAGRRPIAAVFDGDFRGAQGMPPFIWNYQSGQDGNAEIAKAGPGNPPSLEINYFGDDETGLAEQTLAIKPGRYRLSSTFRGESSSPDIRLSWTLTCHSTNQPIGALRLQPLGSASITRETAVSVPLSGCGGQKLTLVGQPSDLSSSLSAQITNVSLVSLD